MTDNRPQSRNIITSTTRIYQLITSGTNRYDKESLSLQINNNQVITGKTHRVITGILQFITARTCVKNIHICMCVRNDDTFVTEANYIEITMFSLRAIMTSAVTSVITCHYLLYCHIKKREHKMALRIHTGWCMHAVIYRIGYIYRVVFTWNCIQGSTYKIKLFISIYNLITQFELIDLGNFLTNTLATIFVMSAI